MPDSPVPVEEGVEGRGSRNVFFCFQYTQQQEIGAGGINFSLSEAIESAERWYETMAMGLAIGSNKSKQKQYLTSCKKAHVSITSLQGWL